MNKLLILLLLLVAGGLTWMLLSEDDSSGGWDPDDPDDFSRESEGDPTLMGADGARPRPVRPAATEKTQSEKDAEREAALGPLFLQGVVVSAADGTPIPGARLWAEPAAQPCPRLPARAAAWTPLPASLRPQEEVGAGVPPPPATVMTDKAGRFSWRLAARDMPRALRLDVFIQAPGFVPGVLCQPTAGEEVTVRLQKALRLPITVTDQHKRPLEGAQVTVRPAEGTDAVPGHAGLAYSNKEGRCEIDGLLPGAILVTADHPHYMPGTFGPFDPGTRPSVECALAPALRLTFQIRSDDGSAIENPVLTWKTDGAKPASDLQLLQVKPAGPPAAPLTEVLSAPVRIPCTDRNVQLEVKADGFQPWRPAPEPLPVSGGERRVVASLTRDTTLAPLTVKFQDEDGEAISYRTLAAKLDPPRPLDGQAVGAITLEAAENLVFPSLPPGRYQFGVRMPRYAPALFEAQLVVGEQNEHIVTLSEPARFRIRFVAPEQMTVKFRVLQDGQPIQAFPLKENGEPASGTGALQAAGNEGTLFGGLPSGTITIEVTSEELQPSSTSVSLQTGDTTDVEIEVERK